MLQITSITGNIFHDKKYNSLKNEEHETIQVSRVELEKSRMRRTTNIGTDVAILLESGIRLHNGDVLTNDGKWIIIEQIPEKVIKVSLKNGKESSETLVLLGHIIGNRHRPISIRNNMVFFPIQADSELSVFERLFADIIDRIDLSIDEIIFSPHVGADVHEH